MNRTCVHCKNEFQVKEYFRKKTNKQSKLNYYSRSKHCPACIKTKPWITEFNNRSPGFLYGKKGYPKRREWMDRETEELLKE